MNFIFRSEFVHGCVFPEKNLTLSAEFKISFSPSSLEENVFIFFIARLVGVMVYNNVALKDDTSISKPF